MRALDMDHLLQQMSGLADQAGDWRDHLPYEAAAGFLDDAKYQQRYSDHVDGCQYCRQLIDTLHPRADTMAKLLSVVAAMPHRSEASVDFADAVEEARWDLDSMRDALLAQSHAGTLRTWARVQQWLVHASRPLKGPDIGVLMPWTETVALSLGTQPYPTLAEGGRDQFGDIVEEAVSLLLASRFRVAYAGDLQPGGISERICNLAHEYGRRRVTLHSKENPADADVLGFGVTEYCAWPVHMSKPLDEVKIWADSDHVQWLTLQGEPRPYSDFVETVRRLPAVDEWVQGLTALRETMVHDSLGHIAMGGSTDIDHGAMPSLAQDALVSLRNRHPLYVLGGFGGCARELAAALRLTDAQPTNCGKWHGFDEFSLYIGADNLHNGLNASENQMLAKTTDVEEAMKLVVVGLGRVASQL